MFEPKLTEMTNSPTLGTRSQPATHSYGRVNAATARGVHRHSRFVGILRWVLPFFCVLIIGIFLFSSGILHDIFAPQVEVIKPEIKENTVEMVQPRMSGLDKKKRAYELTAETATQNTDDPTKVTLDNITGSLDLNENDGKISITAKSGLMDTETNFLKLREDIIISSKRGYTAYLTSVDAKLKEKYITSSDPVLIEWENGSIKANGLEITESGNVIRFLNRVKVKLRPKPAKKDLK